ncbi:MAG TPA: glycosyltransferase family 4 protein [Pyrinomonadaceae bacterium]|nr:glycosyltransferase family 4 protein [Pyrinomonadaceae bacterium]
MNKASLLALALVTAVISAAGVYFVRKWTLRKGMLDIPNERSSHSEPTPRGGGIVIAIVSLTAFAIYSLAFRQEIAYGFLIGAVLIVVVSWIDDVRDLPPAIRIAVHVIAAALLLIDRGSYPIFVGGEMTEVSTVLEFIVSLLFIVWFINAYNFMDGIDGIAGVQSLAASAGWCALGVIAEEPAVAVLACVIFATSLSFLLFNWQPAKIFMGDAGSAFLGFTFSGIGLLAPPGSGIRILAFPVACLLLWPFMFDAFYTLVKRLLRHEKIWHAHRNHIYQQLVIRGYSHATVSIFYGVLALSITIIAVTMPAIGHSLVPAWIAAGAAGVLLLAIEYSISGRRASAE